MRDALARQPEEHENPRLSRAVLRILLRDLREGRYERGARLPAERELAKALQVSRPIVREALLALDLLGFVETRVGSGTYVVDAPDDLGISGREASPFEILDALSTLECSALRHAAGKIDDATLDRLMAAVEDIARPNADFETWHLALRTFHEGLAATAKNAVLSAMIGQLWEVRHNPSVTHKLTRQAWLKGALVDCGGLRRILAALRVQDHDDACHELQEEYNRVLAAVLDVYADEALARTRAFVSKIRDEFVSPHSMLHR